MPTNIQLKSSGPWFVIEGTPAEIADVIRTTFPNVQGDGTFPGLVKAAQAAWSAGIEGGRPAQAQGSFGTPQAETRQATPQGGGGSGPFRRTIGKAEWGQSAIVGLPDAPIMSNGQPAVLFVAKKQSGELYSMWVRSDDKRATDDRNGTKYDEFKWPQQRGYNPQVP